MIKELDITHVSAYSLILEEKTVFEKWLREGKIELLDNDLEAEMFSLVMNELKAWGYVQYEVSNYCKNGLESIHNKVYWKNEQYYGFGVGASGYINKTRYYNVKHVNQYLQALKNNKKPVEHEDHLTVEDQIAEELILGLRLINGVSLDEFRNKYNQSLTDYYERELSHLIKKDLIELKGNQLSLTKTGLLKGNEVFAQFLR